MSDAELTLVGLLSSFLPKISVAMLLSFVRPSFCVFLSVNLDSLS